MIKKPTIISCSNCGKEFYTEYNERGSICHQNVISNIKVYVHRWENGCDRNDAFLSIIGLDVNFLEAKRKIYKVGLETYKCCMLWLKKNGPNDMFEYLKGRETDIKEEYNKIKTRQIEELSDEIKKLEGMIL